MNDLVITTPNGSALAVPDRMSRAEVVAFGRASENYMAIAKLTRQMRAEVPLKDQPECPVTHTFNGKMYIRECRVPKGSRVISRIHRTRHLFVLSQGAAVVWTEHAGVEILVAPHIGITPPGTLRVLQALEDTVWTTFHNTEKTSVAEVMDEIVIDPEELLLEN
jgi:hypothetical protein